MTTYQLKKQLKENGFIYNRGNRYYENLWMQVLIEDEFHMYVEGSFQCSKIESGLCLGHYYCGWRFSYSRMTKQDLDDLINLD